jgi:DNA mismatch repair protein MutS
VLALHERQEGQTHSKMGRSKEQEPSSVQLAIFTPLSQQIVDRLRSLDVNQLTPIEALNLLNELHKQLA